MNKNHRLIRRAFIASSRVRVRVLPRPSEFLRGAARKFKMNRKFTSR